MTNRKHIVIFSHGFGVRKDDRGLFIDIAKVLPGADSIMFDYNEVDEKSNTLTVRPFSKQVEILKEKIDEQKKNNPDATIDLICHSQGSRIAAMACPAGIRKIILISPPSDTGMERTLARYKDNPEAIIDLNGTSKLPRSDGSISFVPAEYWQERENEVQPVDSYNALASTTELIIIKPTEDTVLGNTSFDGLNKKVAIIELKGDHDFSQTRPELCDIIEEILM